MAKIDAFIFGKVDPKQPFKHRIWAVCSACRFDIDYALMAQYEINECEFDEETGTTPVHIKAFLEPHYCPHCGEKLEGAKD